MLRGLEHLRKAEVAPDDRADEALRLVEARRGEDGRWLRQNVHPGAVHFDIDAAEGGPSRWATLSALRVLRSAEKKAD